MRLRAVCKKHSCTSTSMTSHPVHIGTSQMQIAMMRTKLFTCLQSMLPKCCSSRQSPACSFVACTQQMHLSLMIQENAFTLSP